MSFNISNQTKLIYCCLFVLILSVCDGSIENDKPDDKMDVKAIESEPKSDDVNGFSIYEVWKQKYGKVSTDEESKRRDQFMETDRRIHEHNRLGNSGYKLGHNQFSDLDFNEFKRDYCGTKCTKHSNLNYFKLTRPKRDTVTCPESWDWRKYGVVSPVRFQDRCGSCWAFSAICALESQMMIKSLCLYNKTISVDLSEQQLVDCSESYGNAGCDGGSMDTSFSYIQAKGIENENDYPYVGGGSDCQYNSNKCVRTCIGYQNLEPYNEVILKQTVYKIGPVCGAISVQPDFMSYSSGIYNNIVCPRNTTAVDHGINIIGYGKENGTSYWICRNSWGYGWGENGYFRIKTGNTCNVASYTCIPYVSNTTDTRNCWFGK